MDFRVVNIMSEGVRLQGELFTPHASAGKPLPTIIMAHGWGGVPAEFCTDAVDLTRADCQVLTFDYREWGESDSRVNSGVRMARGELGYPEPGAVVIGSGALMDNRTNGILAYERVRDQRSLVSPIPEIAHDHPNSRLNDHPLSGGDRAKRHRRGNPSRLLRL